MHDSHDSHQADHLLQANSVEQRHNATPLLASEHQRAPALLANNTAYVPDTGNDPSNIFNIISSTPRLPSSNNTITESGEDVGAERHTQGGLAENRHHLPRAAANMLKRFSRRQVNVTITSRHDDSTNDINWTSVRQTTVESATVGAEAPEFGEGDSDDDGESSHSSYVIGMDDDLALAAGIQASIEEIGEENEENGEGNGGNNARELDVSYQRPIMLDRNNRFVADGRRPSTPEPRYGGQSYEFPGAGNHTWMHYENNYGRDSLVDRGCNGGIYGPGMTLLNSVNLHSLST